MNPRIGPQSVDRARSLAVTEFGVGAEQGVIRVMQRARKVLQLTGFVVQAGSDAAPLGFVALYVPVFFCVIIHC